MHTDLGGLDDTSVIPRPRLIRELSEPSAAGDPVIAGLRLDGVAGAGAPLAPAPGRILRIAARLVEVATQRVRATCEVRGPLDTLSALQRDSAAALASELKGVVPPPRTVAGATTAIDVLEELGAGP